MQSRNRQHCRLAFINHLLYPYHLIDDAGKTWNKFYYYLNFERITVWYMNGQFAFLKLGSYDSNNNRHRLKSFERDRMSRILLPMCYQDLGLNDVTNYMCIDEYSC